MAFFEEHGSKIWASVFTGITGAIAWIVRTVFTNNKRLDLLEQKTDMQHKETVRRICEISDSNKAAITTQAEMLEMLREIKGSR